MIPKALLTAATDPELESRDLAVYVFLHAQLDYLSYRRLKQTWLTRQLRMSRTRLSHSISKLLERGYLELDPEQQRGRRGALSSYRIPFSPAH